LGIGVGITKSRKLAAAGSSGNDIQKADGSYLLFSAGGFIQYADQS
jgi:hypothetical protein